MPVVGYRIAIEQGDITKVKVDAIVNAANSKLIGGGGVDGAIHSAAGRSVMVELDRIRPEIGGFLPTGQAVATGAGKLSARYIFHAVGPVWRGGGHGEADALASCYRVCLELAEQHQLKSIAFPAISTGIYGYPLAEAAEIALGELRKAQEGAVTLEDVRMVLYGAQALAVFDEIAARYHRAV